MFVQFEFFSLIKENMYSTFNKPVYSRSKEFGIYCNQLDVIKEILLELLNDSLKLVTDKFDHIETEYQNIKKENWEEGEIFYQHDYEPRKVATYELKETICFTSIGFLFTQFETKIIELANLTAVIFHSEIEYEHYSNKCRKKNKGINKAKNFIIDIAKIDISDIESSWSKIKQFQYLRNCIIHRNGRVNKDSSIIQFAQSTTNLNYHVPSDRIQIKKEFVEEFINILFNYLEQLVKKLYNKLYKQ